VNYTLGHDEKQSRENKKQRREKKGKESEKRLCPTCHTLVPMTGTSGKTKSAGAPGLSQAEWGEGVHSQPPNQGTRSLRRRVPDVGRCYGGGVSLMKHDFGVENGENHATIPRQV